MTYRTVNTHQMIFLVFYTGDPRKGLMKKIENSHKNSILFHCTQYKEAANRNNGRIKVWEQSR